MATEAQAVGHRSTMKLIKWHTSSHRETRVQLGWAQGQNDAQLRICVPGSGPTIAQPF